MNQKKSSFYKIFKYLYLWKSNYRNQISETYNFFKTYFESIDTNIY